MKAISDFLLKFMGWKIDNEIPREIKKAVIIVAPHSSYWDFVMGRLAFWHMQVDTKFLVKKEAFFWPLGKLMLNLGAMPVNRGKSYRLTETVTQMYDDHESLFITITPEGTRTLVKEWKKGFYYIAISAKVPIILGVLDYKDKIGGMKKVFYPTGNMKQDIAEIKKYYVKFSGKNPERSKIFNLPQSA